MSGTTNVDQTNQSSELEFRLLQFMEKERTLTVEEKQNRDISIKIKRYLKEKGAIEVPVYPNKEVTKDIGR